VRGRRIATYANGDHLEIEFDDETKESKGIYILANGDRYEGEFRDGKAAGVGTYTWVNGNRYEGEVRDGKRHGKGVMAWTNGARYEGEFREGRLEGRGTYTDPYGNRYEGEFLDSRPDGNGALFRADGEVIEGPWVTGCLYIGARLFAFRRPLEECELAISNEETRSEHGLVSKWKKYADTHLADDSDGELYDDPATVKKHGDFVRVSELQNLMQASKAGEMSRRILAEYDCGEDRFRFLLFTAFSEQMAHGKVVGLTSMSRDWHRIAPGSVLSDRRKTLCQ